MCFSSQALLPGSSFVKMVCELLEGCFECNQVTAVFSAILQPAGGTCMCKEIIPFTRSTIYRVFRGVAVKANIEMVLGQPRDCIYSARRGQLGNMVFFQDFCLVHACHAELNKTQSRVFPKSHPISNGAQSRLRILEVKCYKPVLDNWISRAALTASCFWRSALLSSCLN